MKPFLRRLAEISFDLKNKFTSNANKISRRTKVIAVSVLSTFVVSVLFTGITLANKAVYIKDGETETVVYTFMNDPYKILASQDFEITDDDTVVYNKLDNNKAEIIVTRAFEISISVADKKQTVLVSSGTVADALKKADITVSGTDRLNVALSENVHENTDIIIDKVEVKTETKKVKVNYKTVTKKSSSLLKGERVVKNKGKKGTALTTTETVVVNGEVESSKVISKTVTKKAKKRVVLVGTKPATGVDKIGGAGTIKYKGKKLKYSKKLVGSATAYSAPKGAGTASGRRAKYGNVAVNPKVIPYGTKLFIKTTDGSLVYGRAVAADTGGALASGKALVDLYFNTYNQCCKFGRRQVEVYVLK